MKTPHTITLIRGDEPRQVFNPITGEYETVGEEVEKDVPCLFNFISQEKEFMQYGTREGKLAIARFNQEQEPFNRAKHKGESYIPVEAIDAPIKGAVRLRKVVADDG